MSEDISFANQFLVAMPSLEDENFHQSVTLLCEHHPKGAMGVVINRPMTLRLRDMLSQMELSGDDMEGDPHVYWGGPVSPERGFVIHSGPDSWPSSMPLGNNLYITTSKDILKDIGHGNGPQYFVVALGYAGWEAGQLEKEMLGNSWLNTPVDNRILFRTSPDQRWKLATRLLGVDVSQLAGDAGHA